MINNQIKRINNFSTNPLNEEVDDNESFGALFEQSLNEKKVVEGNVMKGTVVGVTQDGVMVDIGYKSEGLIPNSQFRAPDSSGNYKVGDKIDVTIDRREGGTGQIILSKERADQIRAWKDTSDAFEKGGIVEGRIANKVRGGFTVDILGVEAFLPASQADTRPVRDTDHLINKICKFTIIEFNKQKGNIVLSRKSLLEEEAKGIKEKLLREIYEGMILQGTVKNLTDYGVFVDLGNIDGLLHITDISWGRVSNPSDVFKVGDKIKVVVLKYDKDKQRISLGHKQLFEDPWKKAAGKYPIGSKIKGKVVSNADYGTFVEIESGIEGLIHVSEMSWTKKIKHPSKLLAIGDAVEAVVLALDADNRRLSLGLKQIENNPWNTMAEKYPKGIIVERPVKNVTDFGVFVEFEEGIDGLIHISDIAWGKKPKSLKETYHKGDMVKAKVMEIKPQEEKISLSIKDLTEDPWKDVGKLYKKGAVVTGIIKNITEIGAFVELKKDVEALIHISEIKDDKNADKNASVPERFKVGEEIKGVVAFVSVPERKISISIKDLEEKLEREDVRNYLANQQKMTSTLMDVVKSKDADAKNADTDKGNSETNE